MSTLKVDTILKRTGTGTITVGQSGDTISIPAGANATLGGAGSTITVPSGCTITNNGTQTGFGGTNTPFILVRNSATQSLSTGTATKIVFDTELVDTDNEFSSNKWTCGTAGRYFFNCTMELQTMNDEKENWMKIYKNGNAMIPTFTLVTAKSGAAFFNSLSIMLNVAANDYFEIYTVQNNGNSRNILAESAVWSIMRVIES